MKRSNFRPGGAGRRGPAVTTAKGAEAAPRREARGSGFRAACRLEAISGVQDARAHGGCLGGGRRRRTRQAAKSPGETHAVFDPGVSEWGNPPSSDGAGGRIHGPRGANPAK